MSFNKLFQKNLFSFPDSLLFWSLSAPLVLFNIFNRHLISKEILFLSVSVIGISHGSTDFLILKNISPIPRHLFYYSLLYFVSCLLLIFTWYAFPAESLIFFLLISAYHFGCDWQSSGYQRCLMGMGLLSIPIFYHPIETMQIFQQISIKSAPLKVISLLHQPIFFTAVLQAFYAILQRKWSYLEYLFLVFSGSFLDPMSFFTYYFCFLHSIRHIKRFNQSHHIQPREWGHLISISILSWLCLPILCVLMEINLSDMITLSNLKPLFVFIFSITVPHMILEQYTKYTQPCTSLN